MRIDARTVALAPPDLLARFEASSAGQADTLDHDDRFMRLRDAAMPEKAEHAALRLTADLSFEARLGLGRLLGVDAVPVAASVWGDVADDLAVVALLSGDDETTGEDLADVVTGWRAQLQAEPWVRERRLTALARDLEVDASGNLCASDLHRRPTRARARREAADRRFRGTVAPVSTYLVKPAAGPLGGTVSVPGDKSLSHRAVIFGSLASGQVRVRGLGDGADNRGTARAMAALGVPMAAAEGGLLIDGVGVRGLRAPATTLDCGNSGTAMRLLIGLLAAQPFASELTGDESLRGRPMRRVIDPLAAMGAVITGLPGKRAGDVYPPLRLAPAGGLRGLDYALPMASAQVKSAILLAALYAEGATQLVEPGPSRDHTERMLRYLGAPVVSEAGGRTSFDPGAWDGSLAARPLDIPGDPSSAAFLVAAALVAGSRDEVRVRGVCVNETRTGFLDALAAMGADVALEDAGEACGEPIADLVVRGPRRGVAGTEVGGELLVRCLDEVPVLAVVAAMGEGTTWFRDAAELRVKESDRIATTAAMLRAFGVEVIEEPEAFAVVGRAGAPLAAAHVDAAGDHRIAMAAAVAALAADGDTRIDDVDNVATSYPGFPAAMASLGAELSR